MGGAVINCWIQRDTLEEAQSYARGFIADEDWIITHQEDGFLVTRDTQDPKGMRYFEQAEIDQEVFVSTLGHRTHQMMAHQLSNQAMQLTPTRCSLHTFYD